MTPSASSTGLPSLPGFASRVAMALLVVMLGACASRSLTPAPVEDRARTGVGAPAGSAPSNPATGATAPATASGTAVVGEAAATKPPPPGSENAGKPGYYTVKPGDTIIRIGLETGQKPRDVVRWNALANPNLIEVGQVLRVVPPGADLPVAVASGAVARPVASGAVGTGSVVATTLPPAGAASASRPAASAPPSDEDVSFIWPAVGTVITNFDGDKNKGLDIAGKLGDPILAAADGQVVYAGAGLRTYGNLIILKHNNTYLTAYAHNQALLVKEDQVVRKGQKIAEMGQSDTDRVKLHFEVRRMGTPINPAKMLPAK